MSDPMTGEPREDELPPKPPISDPMPTDAELEADSEPGEEDVPEEDVMSPEQAAGDDTVDDAEHDAAD
jgi:hypothetical protein